MSKTHKKWLTVVAVLGMVLVRLLSVTSVAAELTEAGKKALEAEKKALELAAEGKGPELQQEVPQGQGQQQETPQEEAKVELTEAEKKALEAAKKAAENNRNQPDQGGDQVNNQQVTKGSLDGRISAIGSDSITVGITGDNTFKVTGQTRVTFNGQVSNLIRLHLADKVSVQYNPVTNVALSVEAEGYYWGSAIYTDVTTVIGLQMLGHTPGQHFGMVTANGAGVFLDPGLTEVTVNGTPATINDIQVGDNVDYVQNALDLKAFWVKVTR